MKISQWFDRAAPRISGYAAFVAAMGLALPTPPLMAQVEPGQDKAVVQVIDPAMIPALIGSAPWNAGGPADHRMVVNHADNGSIYLDMGYNTYKKGVVLSTPYAYKTDEVCILASGHIRMTDGDGQAYDPAVGHLMWRAAGGVTKSAEFLQDTVTICSMAPARLDANGHRVAPQDVGKWEGDPAAKPRPRWLPVETAPVITSMDKSATTGVVEREVLSKRKDGSAKVSVIYTTFKAGAHVSNGSTGEDICWVDNGTLRLTSDGKTKIAGPQTFFYRPAGAKIDRIEATESASMICFTGPAAL